METYHIQAIVLARTPWREADLRVSVFSPEKGRINLVVRGAKKIHSKLAGHVEPFNMARMMVVRGKNFDYVGAAVSDYCFCGIKADGKKIEIGLRALNFFNKLVKEEEGDGAREVFATLYNFFQSLEKIKAGENLLLQIFIFRLLAVLGYGADSSHCSSCGKKFFRKDIYFNFNRRGFFCPSCAGPNDLHLSENLINFLSNIPDDQLNDLPNNNALGDELARINESLSFDL